MDKKYFRSNVVYQIYPRSFCDSNGDGIGDIPGIISKLDYLKDLGIGIIWLSPVYKSPNCDYGYDISDYKAIQPEFGTMEDMDRLIAEAKKRGIRIIMDLVVNHTSDEHPWFQASRDPKSPYHGYYYWRKGRKNNKKPPNNWTSDFGGSAWKYDPEVDEWYLHLFSEKQVDLDWHNPKILEEVEDILRFWLDKGIYGFRCDVINQIWKEDLDDAKFRIYIRGLDHYLNKQGNHVILQKLHEDVFSKYDCMTVGECYNVTYEAARQFTSGNELDMCFHFDAMHVDQIFAPVFHRKYKPQRLKKILFDWQQAIDWNANYFENHDQLRSIERFGSMDYRDESAKTLALMLMTLRGTPYVYQGEEIGMTNINPYFEREEYRDPVNHWIYEIIRKIGFSHKGALKHVQNCNRDNARTPMQWSAELNGGFSSGKPWIRENENYVDINVESQLNDPDSIYSFYKKAIGIRKEIPALSYGSFEPIETSNSLMAFKRVFENEAYLVLINMTPHEAKIPDGLFAENSSIVLSNYADSSLKDLTSLRPFESLLIRL